MDNKEFNFDQDLFYEDKNPKEAAPAFVFDEFQNIASSGKITKENKNPKKQEINKKNTIDDFLKETLGDFSDERKIDISKKPAQKEAAPVVLEKTQDVALNSEFFAAEKEPEFAPEIVFDVPDNLVFKNESEKLGDNKTLKEEIPTTTVNQETIEEVAEEMAQESSENGEKGLEETPPQEKEIPRRRRPGANEKTQAKKSLFSFFSNKKNKKNEEKSNETVGFSPEKKVQKAEKPKRQRKRGQEQSTGVTDNEDVKNATLKNKTGRFGNYPRHKEDPTDMEIINGKPHYFFNAEKTLTQTAFGRMITKNEKLLLFLDDITYDKFLPDKYAQIQHNRAVKYNAADPKTQKRMDIFAVVKKASVLFAVAVFIGGYQIINVLPVKNYNEAIINLKNGYYEQSYIEFTELKNYKNSPQYAVLSQGHVALQNKKYDEAKQLFESLVPYQKVIGGDYDVLSLVKESEYQKALELYNASDYPESSKIFKEIHDYKDSTDFYYKIQYRLGNDKFENGEYEDAMKYFANILDYQDAQERYDSLGEQFYKVAQDQYERGDYETAKKNFEFLAELKYKDSPIMLVQCSYKYGIELYERGSFISSIKIMSEIPKYKDAYAIIREGQYKYAKNLFSSDPLKAIPEFEKIKGYKDADKFLSSPKLVLYGEWQIVTMNDTAVPDVYFTFNEKNEIVSKKQISNLAITTDATPRVYEWREDRYVHEDYQIFVSPESSDQIQIVVQKGDAQTVFGCVRVKDYSQMLGLAVDDSTSNESPVSLVENFIGAQKEKEKQEQNDEVKLPAPQEKEESIEDKKKNLKEFVSDKKTEEKEELNEKVNEDPFNETSENSPEGDDSKNKSEAKGPSQENLENENAQDSLNETKTNEGGDNK